jgi:pyruvate kinase
MKAKKTKIVATMGPSTADKAVLKEMIEKGVNVCRLNFSHGVYEDHAAVVKMIREINDELGTFTSILADLQGPKIRIGAVENDSIEVANGSTIILTTEECVGTNEKVYINYKHFPRDVKVGEEVRLDDGKLTFVVVKTDGENEVTCRVEFGGTLSSRKGVNLPNTRISMPSLTEKDRADLKFALEHDVDWIGLSFVRSARDIIELRHLISEQGAKARIIAKIEKPEAIEDIDAIIEHTDALMVARGDLGVEIPMQNVPLIQKMLVKKCLTAAKPVIIATQMMESMITNISPSRAEVNDVANAVTDGADAVMLSGETSVGDHPIKVIEAMNLIVEQAETFEGIYYKETVPAYNQERFITDSICYNSCRLAQRVGAQAIVTMTHSGYTAFKVSSQRPKATVYVFTSNRSVMTKLNLVWGVKCFYYNKMVSTDHTIADIKYILRKAGELKDGDLVINIASMPISEQGMSNMVKLSYVK